MNKEEAKELLPIIQAFTDGKQIQYSDDGKYWYKTENPSFASGTMYSIKPEPKYRPFKNQEQCWNEMLKHQPFGWIKNSETGNIFNIIVLTDNVIKINGCYSKYSNLFENHVFIDGTSFGVKEN